MNTERSFEWMKKSHEDFKIKVARFAALTTCARLCLFISCCSNDVCDWLPRALQSVYRNAGSIHWLALSRPRWKRPIRQLEKPKITIFCMEKEKKPRDHLLYRNGKQWLPKELMLFHSTWCTICDPSHISLCTQKIGHQLLRALCTFKELLGNNNTTGSRRHRNPAGHYDSSQSHAQEPSTS